MNVLGIRPLWPRLTLVLLLSLGGPVPASLSAQDTTTRECRCVDSDGRAIENCTCFRTPNVQLLRANRARIGVTLEEAVDGARVTEVRDGSPAASAGLIEGDVITRVGGQSLREPLADRARERRIDEDGDVAVQRLMALASDWEVGEAVELEYTRAGERRTVSLTPEATPREELVFGPGRVRAFGDAPGRVSVFGPDGRFEVRVDSLMRGFRFDMDSLRSRMPTIVRADSLARSRMMSFSDGCFAARGALLAVRGDCVDGVHLMELNPELGEYFGATRGVLVSAVDDGSTLGLRPGDVILEIGGRAVEEPEQARRILASYERDEEVPLRIRRRGEEMDVEGRRR